MPEVMLMNAAEAKVVSDSAISAEADATKIRNNYLRDIGYLKDLNTEILKKANAGQYVLWLPITDLQYRTEIEELGYIFEEVVKNNIAGVNICWS